MIELLPMLSSAAVGLLLGGFFFYGLWLTVSHLGQVSRPVGWMLVSLLLRFGFVFGVFLSLARTLDALHLLAVVVGFFLARGAAQMLVTRVTCFHDQS